MSELRDKIREQTRLRRIRLGQEVAELVEIPSLRDSVEPARVALVPLTEAESQQGMIAAASLNVPDNSAGFQARNRATVHSDVWNACRIPGDTDKKVWASVQEMVDDIEPSDIDWLFDNLTTLMDYASPSMDGISDEDLAELKNGFALIDWKELSGRRWSALKLCLSILSPELLQARFSSTTSTRNLTPTSESDEST